MGKGEANIDIVFRNGLRDFEVLPPNEVWGNISPVIKSKSRPFFIFKVAAAVSVLMILSFLGYRLTRDLTPELNSSLVSPTETVFKSTLSPKIEGPAKVATILDIARQPLTEAPLEISSITTSEPDNQFIAYPTLLLLNTKANLAASNSLLLKRLPLVSLNSSSNDNTVSLQPDDLQYLPENSVAKKDNKWSIAAMASPTYYSNFGPGSSNVMKQLSASEQPMLSYSGGVALSYKISKRLSIQSGIYYSSVGQEVDGINSFGGFQKYDITKGDRNFEILTTSGTVYTNNGDVFLVANGSANRVVTAYTNDVFDPKKASLQYLNNTLRQNFSYLELPVILRYKIIDKTIDFNLIGGISYNMLMNNSVYTMVDGSKYSIGKTEGLNQISFSSSLGMGMEYNFSEKLSLNLEPMVRYYLNPYSQATSSKLHPYSFGIFSGLSYKF